MFYVQNVLPTYLWLPYFKRVHNWKQKVLVHEAGGAALMFMNLIFHLKNYQEMQSLKLEPSHLLLIVVNKQCSTLWQLQHSTLFIFAKQYCFHMFAKDWYLEFRKVSKAHWFTLHTTRLPSDKTMGLWWQMLKHILIWNSRAGGIANKEN